MFDAELLRKVCKELLAEKDSERLQELLSLLCVLVDDNPKEVRLRLRQLSKRYPSLNEKSTQKAPNGTRTRGKKRRGDSGPNLPS